MSDELPIACHHKGVGIHAGQPSKRVALVKREIDKVSRITDLEELYEIAGDCSWSPESRLFAEARCIAGLQMATERRQARPDIDKEDVEAAAAGLAVVNDGRTPTGIAVLLRFVPRACSAARRAARR